MALAVQPDSSVATMIAMKPIILKPDFSSEFMTPERCSIVESSNSDLDASMSIAHVRVAPGVTTMLHSLQATEERYILIQGDGWMINAVRK